MKNNFLAIETNTHHSSWHSESRHIGIAHSIWDSSSFPLRNRSRGTDFALKALCTVVSAVVVADEIDHSNLHHRYEKKLRSYHNKLGAFALATIPSVLRLTAIYIAFRGIQGLRASFSFSSEAS